MKIPNVGSGNEMVGERPFPTSPKPILPQLIVAQMSQISGKTSRVLSQRDKEKLAIATNNEGEATSLKNDDKRAYRRPLPPPYEPFPEPSVV